MNSQLILRKLFVTTVILFTHVLVSHSAKRCDLLLNQTPGTEGNLSCLDLPALTASSEIIQTAENATRIGDIHFCKNAIGPSKTQLTDIVYIYDNSGSMDAAYAWFNASIRPDTLFFYRGAGSFGSGCNLSLGDTAGQGNLTILDDVGLKTIPRLDSTKTPNDSCSSFSGDPFRQRGVAIRAAIDYQASIAPLSSAGAMSFESIVGFEQSPLVLDSANASIVKASVTAISAGATNYSPPLDTARRWLKAPITNNPGKAIIFLSDGRPTDSSTYQSMLSDMPVVYGVFIGSNTNSNDLEKISKITGGRFFRLPAARPDSLKKLMQRIIDFAILEHPSIHITNSSNGQISKSIRLDSDLNGNQIVSLDSIIGLKLKLNTILVSITKNIGDTSFYNFKIQNDGPVATNSTRSLHCKDLPTLTMLNEKTNLPDKTFSATASTYVFQLKRLNNELESLIIEAAVNDSARPSFGDFEKIQLVKQTGTGDTSILSIAYPFTGRNSSPTMNNGKLETDENGKIILTWVHPRDPKEFTSYTLSGLSVTSLNAYPTSKNISILKTGGFTYVLLKQQSVHIRLYDSQGRVKLEKKQVQTPGIHRFSLGSNFQKGISWVDFRADNFKHVFAIHQ